MLTHDTSLPRPYSRGGRVQGTKGLLYEDNKSIYIEGESPEHEWEDFYGYIKKNNHEHPLWKEYFDLGVKEQGHGGMDYLALRMWVEAILAGREPDISTYDTATLLAVSCLSEASIARGSAMVDVPYFTNGKWTTPRPLPSHRYALDAVYESEHGVNSL